MRIALIQGNAVVNVIVAESVKAAQVLFPGYEAREALPGDAQQPPEVSAEEAERIAYEEAKRAAEAAEFNAFKARSGAPTYKSAAVKIAAEKLGLLATIEAAIMALVDKASDKALYVWWVETDTISRGDTQWQQIEPAVSWGKSSTDDLFALAAQV